MNNAKTEELAIDRDEPPSTAASVTMNGYHNGNGGINGQGLKQKSAEPLQASQGGFFKRVTSLFKFKNNNSPNSEATLREAIEEYIEEAETEGDEPEDVTSVHEKHLLSNILDLRNLSVLDVMIPRADIVAIDVTISQQDLMALLSEKQHSRFPVYRNSLDDVIGTIHIKDILQNIAAGRPFNMEEMVREVPLVSPSMPLLDLILMMRQLRKHMTLVVDEYGGIDGLVAFGDVVEEIMGELDDEYDAEDEPEIVECKDGSLLVDARYDIEDFEDKYVSLLNEEEREYIDTVGGFVSSIAGRVPVNGEIIEHDESGTVFEVLDADPRRVNRLRIKNMADAE